MNFFCEFARLNHAKYSKSSFLGYGKKPCTSMNYHSHNGKNCVYQIINIIFHFQGRNKLSSTFLQLCFSFDVVFCRNNLPSFTSRKIQYGQALPQVVEIFNFVKIVGKICKNEILNHFFLKWTSNNHIHTISTYVGKWNIPCCINIRVLQLVSNVEKLHDLHCIVPKSDGSAFNSYLV